MTLQVDGSDTFRQKVKTAFEEICSCRDIQISSTGAVGVSDTTMPCACYCEHQAGCDLIDTLRGTPAIEFTIDTSQGDSEYDQEKYIVYWAPEWSGPTVDDVGESIPPSAILAHELTHAWLDLLGKDTWNEGCAVRGENKVRAEMCVPGRTTYSGAKIRNCDEAVLEPDDSVCDCSPYALSLPHLLALGRCGLNRVAMAVQWAVQRFLHPPARPGRPMHAPFAAYAASHRSVLQSQYRRALGVRDRAPHRAVIDSHRGRFDASPVALLLESVGVAGRYRAAWIAEEDGGFALVTDFRLDNVPNEPFAAGPVDLVEYRVTDPGLVSRVRARIAALQFDNGLGGNEKRVDGMVQFLWTKAPAATRDTALYGYSYPAIHGSSWRPAGQDGARWDAIVAAYEIWRDLVGAAGAPVSVLARRVR